MNDLYNGILHVEEVESFVAKVLEEKLGFKVDVKCVLVGRGEYFNTYRLDVNGKVFEDFFDEDLETATEEELVAWVVENIAYTTLP